MRKLRILVLVALATLASVPVMAQDPVDLVRATKDSLVSAGVNLSGPCGAFAITGRVAWALRGQGWGLIAKNPAQNGCDTPNGRFAVDALTNLDGSAVDLLINSETDNTPAWQILSGPVAGPNALWRAPFDLGGIAPPPVVTPPAPLPSGDLDVLLEAIADLNTQVVNLRAYIEATAAQLHAEHQQQSGGIADAKKAPWWQVALALVGAIAAAGGVAK